ncbi:MAG: TonB C-terminal domain-containing protein [Verrucomicrobiales bacterium]|nr:TonB C-terminal domain-containing protein [Verrucomicrobiales bacterium]
MNRLEKKCFVASAATHGLLLVLLFAAPAMMLSKKKPLNIPVLTFLPSFATDAMVVGGGEPTLSQPPAPPPAAPPQQLVQQAEPSVVTPVTPQKTEPIIEPKVERAKPPEKLRSEPETVPDKPLVRNSADPGKAKKTDTSKTEKNDVAPEPANSWMPSFTPSKRNQLAKNAQAKARAEAAARTAAVQRAFDAKVQESLKALGSSFAPGTSIQVPGTGGALFANYKLIVEAMYQQAWITPEEINAETAVARAKVVIRRDGTVLEARIIKPSGIRAMDKSVERALELKFIAPFPETSKDTQRLFYINFDLKTKRSL